MHSVTRRGNWVRIILRDGTEVTDRFVCRPNHKRWIEVETFGRILKSDLKAFTILRGSKADKYEVTATPATNEGTET